MKIYTAYMLLARLRCLTLAGVDGDGELEWMGNDEAWNKVDLEEESILRDWELIQQ